MKILTQIKQHKFNILLTAFIAAVVLCIWFFIQGLKKDHSLELVKMGIKLREENREQIIKVRESLVQVLNSQQSQIDKLNAIDSLINNQLITNNNRLQTISNKEYEKSRTKVFNDYSDRDLYEFFSQLPDSDNDY